MPLNYPVLLAEDNPSDLFLMKRAVQRGNLPFVLYHVPNGEEAVSYLKGEGQYGDRDCYPKPSLVISDMKMPRMDGLELLQWMRQQVEWSKLPVVVLSNSGDPREVKQFEALDASSYFVKSVGLNDLVASLQRLMALLPPLAE